MKQIIRGIIIMSILVLGIVGFYFLRKVGLNGEVIILGYTLSPLMMILTAIALAFILITNFFAWIAIGVAIVLLILFYGFNKVVMDGQQMMIVYLLIFGLIDIWISKKD